MPPNDVSGTDSLDHPLDLFSLRGKVALVNGATGTLGSAMAIALAGAGADIAVASRRAARLDALAEKARALGRTALPLPVDVTRPADIKRAVAATCAKLGRLDILLNAVGINVRKPILEMTEDDWDRVMAVNLKGVFVFCQEAARVMIAQGKGKIINMASLTSEIGLPNMCAYVASKGGLSQLTKAMAVEWAKHNICVNCIGPGYYQSEMTAALFANRESLARLLGRIPMGRTGVASDLAGAVVFLASAASDYVTGQTVYVDGGWLAG